MGDSTANEATNSGTAAETQKPKIKYDWYQTDTFVTVNVLIKNLDKDQVKLSFDDMSFSISNLPLDDPFSLSLSKAINPQKCTYRITPTKVELKLKKLNDDLWTELEAAKNDVEKNSPLPLTRRNWDKLVETELKDDAAEGEAALNELFQKIYSEGSDEVKKAMNKSFLESGGTVLSTNWNEVGEKKVDIKPPDGMEWKKWDE